MREYFLNKTFTPTQLSHNICQVDGKARDEKNRKVLVGKNKDEFHLPFIWSPSSLGGVDSVEGVGADIYVHPVGALRW